MFPFKHDTSQKCAYTLFLKYLYVEIMLNYREFSGCSVTGFVKCSEWFQLLIVSLLY